MIRIYEVKTSEVAPTLQALYKLHWEEVANYKDKVFLEVDFELINSLDDKGRLISIVAEEDGDIIGYAMFIISTHLHYKSLVTAANDVLFLREDKRKSGVGLKLINESLRIVKEKGATKVTFHIKPNHDFSPLLKRMGFLHEELIYGKLL